MPGHGNSTTLPAGGFDLARLSQLLLEAAPQKATWLGWSIGGMAALDIALSYPDNIEKLIMVAAQPQFVQSDDWPHAMIKNNVRNFSQALQEDYAGTLKRFLGLQVKNTDDEKDLLRIIRKQVESRPQANPEALRLGLEILMNADLRPVLNKLQCPTQIILGEHDMLVPIATKPLLEALFPKARIDVLAKASHAPFLSHPEIFSTAVDAFLDSES